MEYTIHKKKNISGIIKTVFLKFAHFIDMHLLTNKTQAGVLGYSVSQKLFTSVSVYFYHWYINVYQWFLYNRKGFLTLINTQIYNRYNLKLC